MEEYLRCQIVEADCLLYQAGMIIINQDVVSYVKGGWYIRQAWKHYKKLYHHIRDLHDGQANERRSSTSNNVSESVPTDDVAFAASSHEMNAEMIARLYGAISFGYGAFQLFISLVPPKILWWIQFLGFEGDQQEGLECLERASNTEDMKSPLAT